MYRVTLTVIIAALGLVEGAQAQTSFEVVRAGDGQMTCEALIAETNTLNQSIRARQEAAQRNAAARRTAGRFGRGLLSGLAQSAGSLGGAMMSDNPLTGMVASAAISGVSSELSSGEGAQAAQPSTAEPTVAPQTAEQQRLAHLSALLINRGC